MAMVLVVGPGQYIKIILEKYNKNTKTQALAMNFIIFNPLFIKPLNITNSKE